MTEVQVAACRSVSSCDATTRHKSVEHLISLLGEEDAYAFAVENQIASMIAHALPDEHGDDRWHHEHNEIEKRLTGYLWELDHVAEILAGEGIPVVALKNAGIARGIYRCVGCCPMGDLDVLVRRSDFRKAHELVRAAGYHFEFRSPLEEAELDEAEQSGGAEYWKRLPNGDKLWFELQWRPVAGRWIRPDQEPTADELIERSLQIPGTAVRLLAPEDNLLQVSLHTAKHTYVRAPGFRLHLDVERIVRYQDIDWDIFLARVINLQVMTPVYFSLVLPRLFFETPIPEHVLAELRPPEWKERLILGWLNRAGFFSPDEQKFGRVGYIVFNLLLYDDVRGLLRGLFPGKAFMKEHYSIRHDILLPIYYLKRMGNLIFKRLRT